MRTQVTAFYEAKGVVPSSLLDQDLALAHWKRLHESAQSRPVEQAELALQCITGIAISNSLSKGLNIKMDGGGELSLRGETKIPKLERRIAKKTFSYF